MPQDTDSGVNDFFGDAALPDAKFNAYVTGIDLTGHPYQRLVPAVTRPTRQLRAPQVRVRRPARRLVQRVCLRHLRC